MFQSILVQRAIAAYSREAERHGARPYQPVSSSREEKHDGRHYVVLRSVERTIVVYQVNDGALRRARHAPACILA